MPRIEIRYNLQLREIDCTEVDLDQQGVAEHRVRHHGPNRVRVFQARKEVYRELRKRLGYYLVNNK